MTPSGRSTRAQQGGFTLVELLVVLILVGVVGGVVTASVIRGMDTVQHADDRISAMLDLQRAIERVGRELRVANPLELPTLSEAEAAIAAAGEEGFDELNSDYPERDAFEYQAAREVRPFVVRDGRRYRYRYYLVPVGDGSAELREDVTVYATPTGGAVVEEREGLFIADIANLETGTPLFTYYVSDPDTGERTVADCAAKELDAEACVHRYATATQVRLQLERLVPGQEDLSLETVINIRSTRFLPEGQEDST